MRKLITLVLAALLGSHAPMAPAAEYDATVIVRSVHWIAPPKGSQMAEEYGEYNDNTPGVFVSKQLDGTPSRALVGVYRNSIHDTSLAFGGTVTTYQAHDVEVRVGGFLATGYETSDYDPFLPMPIVAARWKHLSVIVTPGNATLGFTFDL